MWYEPVDPKNPLIKMYCPVCKKDRFLGQRTKNQLFIEHCADCMAMYTWQPNEEKPTVVLDVDTRHKKCGCGTCQK